MAVTENNGCVHKSFWCTVAVIVTPADKLLLIYGSRSKAAKALGVAYETVRLWCLNGIPIGAALRVEKKTRGEITAEQVVKAARSKRLSA